MAYLTRGTDSFVEAVITSAIMFFALGAFVHRIVTGWADRGGIHYRRYFAGRRWRGPTSKKFSGKALASEFW